MLISNRANSILLVAILAVGIALIAMQANGARGGPLDPPAGPASTDGVRESGTPISSLPFTISAPGRYYMTRDLTGVGGQNGVTISASDVTLDLNGFTLHGAGQSGDGVLVSGARTHVVIENGGVRGWYNGIDAGTATLSLISHVEALSNGQASADGSFGMIIGAQSVIENCNVSNNQATGIRASNIAIRNCRVSGNGNDGIYAGNGVRLDHDELRFNAAAASGFYDVRFIGGNFASENALGLIGFDRSTDLSSNVIVRNVYCDIVIIGNVGSSDKFPQASTAAEFNAVSCT